MRTRVLRAAQELGYAPSNIARALITQRSRLIGVLATEMTARNNPDILFHLGHEIQAAGSRMVLFTQPDDVMVEDVIHDLWTFNVDGVIAATSIPDDALRICARRGLPVVLYNRHAQTVPAASVGCDSTTGMRELAALLHRTDTRDAAFIAGPRGAPVSEERLRAAQAAFAEFGMQLRPPVYADYSHDGARTLARSLFDGPRPPDTIVCANDSMALGIIDACRHELGLRVPDDVAVTGFDDIPQAGWPSYALTTLAQPLVQLTRSAVRLLIEHVEARNIGHERRLMPPRLIVRGSTRP